MRPIRLFALLLAVGSLPAAPPAAFAQSSLGNAGPAREPPPTPVRPRALPSPTTRPPAARPAAAPAPPPARPAAARPPAARAPAQAAPTLRRPAQPDRRAARPARPPRPRPAPVAAAPPAPPPPEPPAPVEPSIGIATRLPVPRFAALHSDNVNMRVGPGTNFPIEWNYQRRDLPVQIVGENQLWRRIRDPDGTEGWVSSANLSPRRSVVVRGEERALRVRPEAEAPPVARLRPGVIGRLRRCDADSPWCEVQVGEYRGYLRRTEVWGVAADEVIN